MGVEQNIFGEGFKTQVSKKKLSGTTQKQKRLAPQLTPNAVKVLEKRYLKKDLNGNPIGGLRIISVRQTSSTTQRQIFREQQRHFMK